MAGDTQEQRETLAEWLAKINPLQWLLTLQTLIGSSEFVPTLQIPSLRNGCLYANSVRCNVRNILASTKPLQWLLTHYIGRHGAFVIPLASTKQLQWLLIRASACRTGCQKNLASIKPLQWLLIHADRNRQRSWLVLASIKPPAMAFNTVPQNTIDATGFFAPFARSCQMPTVFLTRHPTKVRNLLIP